MLFTRKRQKNVCKMRQLSPLIYLKQTQDIFVTKMMY